MWFLGVCHCERSEAIQWVMCGRNAHGFVITLDRHGHCVPSR